MTASAPFDLGGKGGRCSGLAIDVKSNILFAACREPQTMVMLNAGDGKIIDALPIGAGVDAAIFNPNTMETYSAQVDGTLTIVKEKSPTSFVVEQTVETKPSAKQMVWDSKTNRILLVAADYGPAPSPAPVGAAPGRGPMMPDSHLQNRLANPSRVEAERRTRLKRPLPLMGMLNEAHGPMGGEPAPVEAGVSNKQGSEGGYIKAKGEGVAKMAR